MLRYHFSYHLSSYILPQYLICGIFPDRAHSNVLVAFWLTSHSRLTKSLILMRSSLLQHPAPQKPRHCLLVAYLTVCSLCTAHPRSGHRTHSPLSCGIPRKRKLWEHPRKPLPEKQQKFGILHLCRQQDKVKGSR